MRNYIEFFFDDDERFIAKIHKQGRVRVIRNEKNVKKLISIAKKYGYDIEDECYIDSRILQIAKEYEEYANRRKNRLRIIGNIADNMKLSRKNKAIGKSVAVSSLAAIIIITGAIGLSHKKANASSENQTQFEIILDNDEDTADEVYLEEGEEVETETEEETDTEDKAEEAESTTELQRMMQEEAFHFSYPNRQTEENISNARRYEDIFQKYGKMYGMDANLLMAMAAQESCGDHYRYLDNGPAEGIMQIEKSVHIGNTVSAYNFETGEVETVLVTREKLQDLETNIKIGTMILRTCMENNNYNIPLAVQTYNLGPGNMSRALDMCCDLEHIDRSELKMDPTNNAWLNYRAFLNTGDSKYVEHVFSFMDNDTHLTILDRDGNPITIRIANDYEQKTYT